MKGKGELRRKEGEISPPLRPPLAFRKFNLVDPVQRFPSESFSASLTPAEDLPSSMQTLNL